MLSHSRYLFLLIAILGGYIFLKYSIETINLKEALPENKKSRWSYPTHNTSDDIDQGSQSASSPTASSPQTESDTPDEGSQSASSSQTKSILPDEAPANTKQQ